MLYGHVDTATIGDGKYFKFFFIPTDLEYVEDTTINGDRYILEGQRDWDDLKYAGTPIDGLFTIQNLPPGDYYLGKITHMYYSGNKLIEKDIKLPKPVNDKMIIRVEKNQLIFWDSVSLVLNEGDYLFQNAGLSSEEINSMLINRIKGSAWEPFVLERLKI